MKLQGMLLATCGLLLSCGGGGGEAGCTIGTTNGNSCSGSSSSLSSGGFTIGGTVTGLLSTVVLQNNGTDDLTITKDGTFTFTTTLAANSSYKVTVKAQPTNPAQICSVLKGTGTVVSGNITDIAVVCN